MAKLTKLSPPPTPPIEFSLILTASEIGALFTLVRNTAGGTEELGAIYIALANNELVHDYAVKFKYTLCGARPPRVDYKD